MCMCNTAYDFQNRVKPTRSEEEEKAAMKEWIMRCQEMSSDEDDIPDDWENGTGTDSDDPVCLTAI